MLVDVVILFEDVVEVPDLDAPVDGRGDDWVLSAHNQALDVHNTLEMGVQHLGPRIVSGSLNYVPFIL